VIKVPGKLFGFSFLNHGKQLECFEVKSHRPDLSFKGSHSCVGKKLEEMMSETWETN
jgi:hypothetical protein